MFSPDVGTTQAARPKRTRHAAGRDDSLKPPQAKRKRSALRRDTFEPLTESSINELAGQANGANGHAIGTDKASSTSSIQPKELTLRGGKKTDKRSERGSGSLPLSSNDFYTVAQLPALPEQIRSRPSIPYSCTLSPEYGLSMALTHTEALIWPYNSSETSVPTRDISSFNLPFPTPASNDPLPLATFTSKSAAGEPGIVAVSPKWGKIVYWENLSNASSFVPGQTSSGVQGSIPSLASGETVKEILNTEPAGFILTTSHGRVAHLTVRDQMGRPAIGVQWLRKPLVGFAGLFGSIRHAFGGDQRRGTPTAKAGMSSKGQRDVLIASEDGEIEFWSINISSGNAMNKVISIKDNLLEALEHNLPDNPSTTMSFRLLDVELTLPRTSSTDLVRKNDQYAVPITVLTSLSQHGTTTYYLVEIVVAEHACDVQVVHPIKCYTEPVLDTISWRPTLYIPTHGEMAHVVFGSAIVLFSLARVEESPSSQLLIERQALPDPFQDCIRFQEDTIYRVIAAAVEGQPSVDNHTSLVFAVQGFGIVRLTTVSQLHEQVDEEEEFQIRISPKSKIEQAVFFGTIRANPLDLTSSNMSQSFGAEEVSAAALEISSDILSSKSKYLPKSAPSIDMQLKSRTKALEVLAHHLLRHHAASLSRTTRFHLLWNAEKLAAARAIWKIQEDIQRRYPTLKDREMPYMQFVLRALHESRQSYPDAAKGESDRVRHWLIHDVEKIGYFLTELVSCINTLAPMDVVDPKVIAEYLGEAQDLWIAAYDAAFKFREDNAHIYGLGDEVFKDGVLQAGYPRGIEDVWTTAPEPRKFGEHFVAEICNFLREWSESSFASPKQKKKKVQLDENGKPYDAPPKRVLSDLAQKLSHQVDTLSRMLDEACILQAERSAPHDGHASFAQIAENANSAKRPQLRKAVTEISHFNMLGAIKLAEKFADTGLLVILNTNYLSNLTLQRIAAHQAGRTKEAESAAQEMEKAQDHTETYYDSFGNGWAFAHFSRNVQDGDINSILHEAQFDNGKKQPYLSWFLQKCGKLGLPVGKIGWINDVIGERRYDTAQAILEAVAVKEEHDLWGKKTQVCLAKLVGLAAAEESETNTAAQTGGAIDYDHALTLMGIQEKIYAHVLPMARGAIDSQAAQDLIVEAFARVVTQDQKMLQKVLRRAIGGLVRKHVLTAFQLVDLLTLLDPVEFVGADDELDPNVVGREFFLALNVVDASDALKPAEKVALQRLIWRRAMNRDDWTLLNETNLKDDYQVQTEMQMSWLFRTIAQVLAAQSELSGGSQKIWSPQEILDVEPFPVSLQSRFEKRELERVVREVELEQERLQQFVEKAQLQQHWEGLVKSAEDLVRAAADEEGERSAREVLGKEMVQTSSVPLDMVENGIH